MHARGGLVLYKRFPGTMSNYLAASLIWPYLESFKQKDKTIAFVLLRKQVRLVV